MVRDKHRLGFTLVEMLLVIALIVGILGLSLPLYRSFQTRNDLDLSANGVVLLLRHAKLLSQGMAADQPWGVHVENGDAVIFVGSSYATRFATDVHYAIPSTFAISGVSEVVFQKMTGYPTSASTLTITTPSNESRIITINAKGTISSQ